MNSIANVWPWTLVSAFGHSTEVSTGIIQTEGHINIGFTQ